MKEKPDFVQKVLQDVLPTIKRMIELEKQFIQRLKESKTSEKTLTYKLSLFKWFKPKQDMERFAHIDYAIEKEKMYLKYYEQRLKEYEEYCLKHWED